MREKGNILLTLLVAMLLAGGVLVVLVHTYKHQEIFRFRKEREFRNRECRNRLTKEMHKRKILLKLMPADPLKVIAEKPDGVKQVKLRKNYLIKSFSEGAIRSYDSFEIILVYERISVSDMKKRGASEGGLFIRGVTGRIPLYLLPFVFGNGMPSAKLQKLIEGLLKITGWGKLLPFMKTPPVSLIIRVTPNYIEEYCNEKW